MLLVMLSALAEMSRPFVSLSDTFLLLSKIHSKRKMYDGRRKTDKGNNSVVLSTASVDISGSNALPNTASAFAFCLVELCVGIPMYRKLYLSTFLTIKDEISSVGYKELIFHI